MPNLKRITFNSGFGKIIAVEGWDLINKMLYRWDMKPTFEVLNGERGDYKRIGQWAEGSLYIEERQAQASN